MFAALMLEQTSAARESIVDELVTFVLFELFHASVLRPSVRMMMTLSRSGLGAAASLNGRAAVNACHAQTRPIVTLVLPLGLIWSTLVLSAVQSLVSGNETASEPHSSIG